MHVRLQLIVLTFVLERDGLHAQSSQVQFLRGLVIDAPEGGPRQGGIRAQAALPLGSTAR
jgi:hypothetical protein